MVVNRAKISLFCIFLALIVSMFIAFNSTQFLIKWSSKTNIKSAITDLSIRRVLYLYSVKPNRVVKVLLKMNNSDSASHSFYVRNILMSLIGETKFKDILLNNLNKFDDDTDAILNNYDFGLTVISCGLADVENSREPLLDLLEKFPKRNEALGAYAQLQKWFIIRSLYLLSDNGLSVEIINENKDLFIVTDEMKHAKSIIADSVGRHRELNEMLQLYYFAWKKI